MEKLRQPLRLVDGNNGKGTFHGKRTLSYGDPPSPAAPAFSDAEIQHLKDSFQKADQGQVFAFWDELDYSQKQTLLQSISQIDPVRANEIFKATMKPNEEQIESSGCLQPLPERVTASLLESSQEEIDAWRTRGKNLIAQNKVAVVLLAGGQGTRLGSKDPKGCFNVGLASSKSLFQLQAERIHKIQQLAATEFTGGKDSGVVVPWYIMTSGATHETTLQFFEDHSYFGLSRENVFLFKQGTLPCFSKDGKIFMEDKEVVSTAPDGNGGVYRALVASSVLSDMQKRGIQHVHMYCVDNCLGRVADPVFIGFSAEKGVDIATKVVRKRAPNESVGLVVLRNGKPAVAEYSEIDPVLCQEKDNEGRLRFRAANIVNHYYSVRFLESVAEWHHTLPYHVAKKKIPHINPVNGKNVEPQEPNGVKLEQFVFDVFPRTALENFACLEVERQEEFSPLKNGRGTTGQDDPDTGRRDILSQGRRWLEAAGAIVTSEGSEKGVEVSPLLSYAGEGLEFLAGKEIRAPAVLDPVV